MHGFAFAQITPNFGVREGLLTMGTCPATTNISVIPLAANVFVTQGDPYVVTVVPHLDEAKCPLDALLVLLHVYTAIMKESLPCPGDPDWCAPC
jgi:hypothetical protein